jgi:hypothetical protein
MINLYRAVGIFAREQPVRKTTERLVKFNPRMVYPMHGSCLDSSVFPRYVEAITNKDFAYTDMLLGQKLL